MIRAHIVLGAAALLLSVTVHEAAIAQQPGYGVAMVSETPTVPAQPNQQLYPRLNAPLYPAPVQGVPPWTGGTVITNQALAPHEMLHQHQYRAMYPPFYYEVKGGWIVTPLGVKQNEHWRLKGTEVRVKYRSHRGPFSKLFLVPR